MASKYKRQSRGGRFKNRGEGLRASVDKIRQQRQTEIDAMKVQATQADNIAKLQISGLTNVGRVESEIAAKKQKLENEIYAKKRNAITVRSDREYEAIMGEAKELGKEAAWWEKFATTHSKQLGKAASGLVTYAQYRQAVNIEETKDPTTAKSYEEIISDSYFTNYGDAEFATRLDLKNDPMIASDTLKKAQGNFFNHAWIGKELKSDVNAIIEASFRGFHKGEINHQNIEEAAVRAGYAIGSERGLPFGSKPFREFISAVKSAARAKASSMANYKRYNDDKDDLVLQSKAYAALMTDLINEASTLDPNSMGYKKIRDKIQTVQKGYHTILNGSFQNLGGGNYGVLTRNPKQLNMEMITNTLPHLNFTSIDQAQDFYDEIFIFDPTDGKTILEKGKPVGILSKNIEVSQHLDEAFKDFDGKRTEARQLREKGLRLQKLQPFQEVVDEAVETGDTSKITNEFKQAALVAGSTAEMQGTQEQSQLFTIGGFDKDKHGSLMKYQQFTSALYSGDVNEALTIFVQQAPSKDGYGVLHPVAKEILSLPEQGKTVTNMAEKLIDNLHSQNLITGLKNYYDENQVLVMKSITTSRIIQLMQADTTEGKKPFQKFEDAVSTVTKEIEAGKKGEGLFAMRKASGFELTDQGYVTKEDASAQGYMFMAADSYIEPGKTMGHKDIQDTFFTTGMANVGGSAVNNYNTLRLEKNIYENLRSNKSILSVEEQRNIIYDGQRGSYDERSIPDNLLSLISMAKEIDPKLTTKNVMDMVVRGITKDGEFESYSDVTWSPNHEDLTKKLVGRCTGNARKNYALCLNSLAEANGIDLSKELINLLRMQ